MPLPDANKRSPRVYTNLQNLDLSTVTFSNIETTGDPIAIEEANEDELRRLVLVNLARLVCAGEWNGLLTAGGADGNALSPNPQAATFSRYNAMSAPYVAVYRVLSVNGGVNTIKFHPFIAGESGDISNVAIYVATAAVSGEARVSFWEADATTGEIQTPTMGTATFDCSSTGLIQQSSLSSTVTLVKGTLYWFGVNSSDGLLRFYGIDDTYGSNTLPAEATSGIQSSGTTGYSGAATFSSGVPTSIPTLSPIDQDLVGVWYDI